MRATIRLVSSAILGAALVLPAAGQGAPAGPTSVQGTVLQKMTVEEPIKDQVRPTVLSVPMKAPVDTVSAPGAVPVQQLLHGAESGLKFDLTDLMGILRDGRHEGWVLSAYPDPKTGQPLIGAGTSLDLPSRTHPQRDPLNPHPFLEPSSAELWQAAGLDPGRLRRLLEEFDHRLTAWSKKGFRKKIRTLEPQISEAEATLLLREAALQAVYNARGYCRYFDRLTGSQQMALSQLVYQMGVNLEEFSTFLNQINGDSARGDSFVAPGREAFATDGEYWKAVQQSLIQSQWARLYRVRAASVIAMLDPAYEQSPVVAELRVGAILRPAVVRRNRGRGAGARRMAAQAGGARKARHGNAGRRAKMRQARKQGM